MLSQIKQLSKFCLKAHATIVNFSGYRNWYDGLYTIDIWFLVVLKIKANMYNDILLTHVTGVQKPDVIIATNSNGDETRSPIPHTRGSAVL